jgi:4-aminobutyrate aminotransferase / (S)-3-amino-2-methylpropionate transaminase / 5-aminovalerate transaminase
MAVDTVPTSAPAAAPDIIRRHTGGGPRRIAELAGLVITHGEGCDLVTDDGRRIIDFATAMGVAAIGHAHPVWTEAVAGQARRLAATVLHTPQQARYLEELARFTPAGLDRIALYSGGAEAVEVSIRLAQSYTGKRNILSFTTGFHGKTAGTRFLGGRFADERARLGIDYVHDVTYPLCTEHDAVDYNTCTDDGHQSLELLERKARETGDVAAVIVELLPGTAGNRPPQRGFPKALSEMCKRNGWLLIADESITGFGRLGHRFASDYFGISPDILVLGKAMGGAFPLTGVAAGGELWDNSLFAELSSTSSSYGANPLACAAGIAVLEIENAPGFLDNVRAVGERLGRGLTELAAASPYVRAPRGIGLMLGFDFVDPATGELADPQLRQTLFQRCLDAGILLVGDVSSVRLNPPLVLTPAEAGRAIDALGNALQP